MLQGVSGPIRCAKMRNLGIIPLIIWVKELPICGCNGRRFSRFSQLSAISAQPSAKKLKSAISHLTSHIFECISESKV
jgi:hypothetical protein